MIRWQIGVRYRDGKVMFYRLTNPSMTLGSAPDWSVDIREILAMLFVGVAALCLIWKDRVQEAMYLLLPLTGYAIGRTIPIASKRTIKKEG